MQREKNVEYLTKLGFLIECIPVTVEFAFKAFKNRN